MTSQVTGQHLGIATANGLAPKRGPRSVIQSINFAIAGSSPKQVNFAQSVSLGKIEFIQTLKIDNSLNPYPLSIIDNNTQDLITCPPYAMMIVPLLASKESPFFTVSTSGKVLVNLYFLSMAIPALVWFPNGQGGASSNTRTDYSANTELAAALAGNLITTVPAGTYNQVRVQNQSANQIQIVLDDGAGNNQSLLLLESGGADNIGGGADSYASFAGRVRIFSIAEAAAPVTVYAQ